MKGIVCRVAIVFHSVVRRGHPFAGFDSFPLVDPYLRKHVLIARIRTVTATFQAMFINWISFNAEASGKRSTIPNVSTTAIAAIMEEDKYEGVVTGGVICFFGRRGT
jgi:hypothetical protein